MSQEVMIPPWVRPESPETIRIIDDATVAFNPAFGRGMTQRGIFADPRWGLRRRYRGLRSDEKAAILNALNESRGQYNTIRVTPHTPIRGSMPTTELITNNTFANGTTGWTPSSDGAVTVSDRVLRVQRTANTGLTLFADATAATVVQYAPYVGRVMVNAGRGTNTPRVAFSGLQAGVTSTGSALVSLAIVPIATSLTLEVEDSAAGQIAGDYYRVPYVSLARCALVDNGPNATVDSDTFTGWAKNAASVAAVGGTAPDGVADAYALTENSANAPHYMLITAARSSVAEDLCSYGFFKRRTGTRDVTLAVDDGAGNGALAVFDLGAGTVGTAVTTGSGASPRAFIQSKGSGWYYCAVVGRCPASTAQRTIAYLTNGGATTYTGDGASNIYAWRAGNARSSVPTIGSLTASSGSPTGTTQSGSGLYTKGWPVSTSGLLLAGDWFEINGELKQLTAPVNSDAAGLAYMQFRPSLAGAPADNDAIVVYEPFGRFIYPGTRELENLFGIYGDCEMNLEEVYS